MEDDRFEEHKWVTQKIIFITYFDRKLRIFFTIIHDIMTHAYFLSLIALFNYNWTMTLYFCLIYFFNLLQIGIIMKRFHCDNGKLSQCIKRCGFIALYRWIINVLDVVLIIICKTFDFQMFYLSWFIEVGTYVYT